MSYVFFVGFFLFKGRLIVYGQSHAGGHVAGWGRDCKVMPIFGKRLNVPSNGRGGVGGGLKIEKKNAKYIRYIHEESGFW